MKVNKIVKAAVLCCVAVMMAFPEAVMAGAWTQAKDGAYVRFAGNFYYADESFNSDGDLVDFGNDGSFMSGDLNAYSEYGLTETITLITSLYYKYLKYDDSGMAIESYGAGDIDLGLKYKWYDGKAGVMALQSIVKIPAYDEDDTLPLGNGQVDLDLRLLWGRSLYPAIPGYFNLEAGYRLRFEEPSDEFRYLVELGIDVTKKMYVRAKLDGIVSMENADDNATSGSNPSIVPEFDLGKLDAVVGYKLGKAWSVEIGAGQDIYGTNTAAGTRGTLAVAYKK